MVDFAALAKAAREKKENAQAEEATPAATGGSGAATEQAQTADSAPRTNPFARRAASAAVSAAVPESAEPVREAAAAVVSDSAQGTHDAPAKPAPKLAGLKFAKAPGTTSPASTSSINSLDDLESLDLSAVEAVAAEPKLSQFADETPAQKPTRELSAELDKQQRQFIELIDGVYDQLHDPEFLGQVIRNIMIELKENPQYIKHICDDDVRVWIRTMRESMGLARVKKLETKAKRGSGGASRSKKVDDDLMADLESLGIDL